MGIHSTLIIEYICRDDLMVQQDLLESGLERLRDAMPGMSLPTGGRGSPTNFGDDQDTPGSSTEEEDMALHEVRQNALRQE